jgi:hypothetical protein
VSDEGALATRHHRFGWWALVVFMSAGLVLESLQGFRVPWLVNVDVETRRTMFRLAHAHGAVLGLVNLALASSLRGGALAEMRARTSTMVIAGSVMLPAGFLLGGVWFFDGDPGLGILLVPIGALLLIAALVDVARRA